jgi:predicted dehydrogenase
VPVAWRGSHQIGYTYRYSRAVEFSRHVIAAGLLGDVVQVRVHGGCSLREAASTHINNDDDMGAALWVIGSHLADLLLAHLGPPVSVNAGTPKFAPLKSATRGEDAAVVTLNYTDRIAAVATSGLSSRT